MSSVVIPSSFARYEGFARNLIVAHGISASNSTLPNDSTLSMRGNDIHIVLLAKFAPGYGGKNVDELHGSIDEGVARFIRLIEDKYVSTAEEHRSVDLARKVQ
jgi:hypothetical protein